MKKIFYLLLFLGGVILTCTNQPNHCQSCTVENKCDVCDQTYSLKSDKSECKLTSAIDCKYTISNCSACNSTNKLFCASCAANYSLKSDKSECKLTSDIDCMFTISNCQTCSSNNMQCESCEQNYSLKYDKSQCKLTSTADCYYTISNCSTCSATKTLCASCSSNYSLKYDKSQCKLTNTTNCLYTIGNCLACSLSNKTLCASCVQNYSLKFDKSQCKLTSEATCLYTLSNCAACSPTNNMLCNSCAANYSLKYDQSECKLKANTTCTYTVQNCQTCNNLSTLICSTCNTGYFLTSTKNCSICPDNCLSCQTSDSCTKCKTNYIVNQTTKMCTNTLACSNITNCKSCNTTNYAQCAGCNSAYYLSLNYSCQACKENCVNCSSENTCNNCSKHYIWNEVDLQCKLYTNESECMSITGCIQCQSNYTSSCILCKGGSKPTKLGKCVCTNGYQLVAGSCMNQSTEVDFKLIDDKEINDLVGMIDLATSGDNKENNTQIVLNQLKSKLTTIDSTTATQTISLLISLADTATQDEAQTDYKELLSSICNQENLDDLIYQSAIAAADKFYTKCNNSEVKKQIYEAGFTTCLSSLLNKSSPSDIPLMKLQNSEFQMKSLKANSTNTTYFFSNSIQINITEDFIKAIPSSISSNLYVVAKSINSDANPYNGSQKNKVDFQSKIVSFTIMQKTDSGLEVLSLELQDNKTFPITFDQTGTTCGHFNTTTQKWEKDGTSIEKTCYFNHTTDFAIFQESKSDKSNGGSSSIIQNWYLFLIILLLTLN